MAKARSVYICQACGHQEAKWLGRCPGCSAWSSFVEEVVTREAKSAVEPKRPESLVRLKDVPFDGTQRQSTGIPELDRVLGGGLVKGALILVGGDPGIGKSTLLLQAVGKLAHAGHTCLYVSAEESVQQVKLRADRLGLAPEPLYLLAETSLEAVDRARAEVNPTVMVIDSIQTVGVEAIESAVGSVSQIRAATQHLLDVSKRQGVTTFVVGHVTKEGAIAGPKVMEHMVDTVLYFEGERTGPYRILRAHKNRFGSAQEIGVFEMDSDGLRAVDNPSELFLSQRASGPGAAVVTSVEGSRPILLEVQALTTPALYGAPRRVTVGFDSQRVAMLAAVLERKAGLDMAGQDIYINVAGGVRLSEPAADLGVVLAIASTVRQVALPADTVFIGEVGLSGEIRASSYLASRVQEAKSLGFARAVVPRVDLERLKGPPLDLPLVGVLTLEEAMVEASLTRER